MGFRVANNHSKYNGSHSNDSSNNGRNNKNSKSSASSNNDLGALGVALSFAHRWTFCWARDSYAVILPKT